MQQHFILSLLLLGFLAACGGGNDDTNGGDAPTSPSGQRQGAFCQSSLNPPSSTAIGSGDPFIDVQWYLDRVAVKAAWGHSEVDGGAGIRIGIIDSGVEIAHEDLKNNVIEDDNLNFIPNTGQGNNPLPEDCDDAAHGTNVAGIIAAEGDNGLGIKGVAYKADIFATNYLASRQGADLSMSLTRGLQETAISSNSWGADSPTRLTSLPQASFFTPIETGLDEGYSRRGISYVFAGGNHRNLSRIGGERFRNLPSAPDGRPYQHLTTYDGLLNQPGVIPVCSVGVDDVVARYSTPGANLWVCGPSSSGLSGSQSVQHFGLPTTDLSGNASGSNKEPPADANCNSGGTDPRCFNFGRPRYRDVSGESLPAIDNATNYHRFFTGTSAATPVVSGVIALMRDAQPALSWRDVKLILAETAEQVDMDGTSSIVGIGWQDAGTTIVNSPARYTHHHDYGFGLVNANAAVELARRWPGIGDLEEVSIPLRANPAMTLSNGMATFRVTAGNKEGIDFVEYIQLEITSNHADVGALQISLTSPGRLESRLAQPRTCLDYPRNRGRASPTNACRDLQGGFTFGSAAHLGEDPQGNWELEITRAPPTTPAITGSARLIIHGHTR